jgi:hypothetical protein
MMVAIPGLVMAFIAKRWRNEYVAFLARLEGITLRHFRPEFHGMTRQFVRKKDEAAKVPVAVRETSSVTEPVLA